VVFDLPEVEGAAVVVEAFAAITKAVAAGELTPEEGAAVAAILEAQRKTIEMVDFEARLTALEERSGQ
jgi:primosomal protein N''